MKLFRRQEEKPEIEEDRTARPEDLLFDPETELYVPWFLHMRLAEEVQRAVRHGWRLLMIFVALRAAALFVLLGCLVSFWSPLSSTFNFSSAIRGNLAPIFGIIAFTAMNTLWGMAFFSARMGQLAAGAIQILESMARLGGIAYVVWTGMTLEVILWIWASTQGGAALPAHGEGEEDSEWTAIRSALWAARSRTGPSRW